MSCPCFTSGDAAQSQGNLASFACRPSWRTITLPLLPAGKLSPLRFERRQLQPGDVRIQIAYCGICHSGEGAWQAGTCTARLHTYNIDPTAVHVRPTSPSIAAPHARTPSCPVLLPPPPTCLPLQTCTRCAASGACQPTSHACQVRALPLAPALPHVPAPSPRPRMPALALVSRTHLPPSHLRCFSRLLPPSLPLPSSSLPPLPHPFLLPSCLPSLSAGHEIVGIVTEVGSVVGGFRVGDRAAVGCMVGSCGDCTNCGRDLEQYCTGVVWTFDSGVCNFWCVQLLG